jgi:hypothetical protein
MRVFMLRNPKGVATHLRICWGMPRVLQVTCAFLDYMACHQQESKLRPLAFPATLCRLETARNTTSWVRQAQVQCWQRCLSSQHTPIDIVCVGSHTRTQPQQKVRSTALCHQTHQKRCNMPFQPNHVRYLFLRLVTLFVVSHEAYRLIGMGFRI